MSGHNKWSQIKGKKGVADERRGVLFSKMLLAISVAAKNNPSPDANPRLRSAIEQAKKSNVPKDNIDRAISKAAEQKDLEELIIEAYGPEGVGMVIEAITDSRNRTTNEIRHLLDEMGAKMATQGSVMWSFSAQGGPASGRELKAKFPQVISEESKKKLEEIISALDEREDVQRVLTNAS